MAAAAIDCVKAAVPVPADPLTAPHPERWGQELLHYDVSKCHGFNQTSTRLGAASCSFSRKAAALETDAT